MTIASCDHTHTCRSARSSTSDSLGGMLSRVSSPLALSQSLSPSLAFSCPQSRFLHAFSRTHVSSLHSPLTWFRVHDCAHTFALTHVHKPTILRTRTSTHTHSLSVIHTHTRTLTHSYTYTHTHTLAHTQSSCLPACMRARSMCACTLNAHNTCLQVVGGLFKTQSNTTEL